METPELPPTCGDASLLEDGAPLAGWYAEPMAAEQAEALLTASRGRTEFAARLREAVARAWLGGSDGLALLAAEAGTPRERALALLVHGQLLTARRHAGALEALEAGFAAARELLAPADYFALLRRHELLAWLPFGNLAGVPAGLGTLLIEAAVIRRLRGIRSRTLPPHSARDTVG